MEITQVLVDPEVVKSVLTLKDVSIIGVLLAIIIYFIWENRNLKKRIEKVIDNHQNDLKEAGHDKTLLLEKYHDFARELRDIVRPR